MQKADRADQLSTLLPASLFEVPRPPGGHICFLSLIFQNAAAIEGFRVRTSAAGPLPAKTRLSPG